MRKVVAAINMTIDGVCDHMAVDADEELHHHYAELLQHAGVILYGKTTYLLMKYWQTLLENPSDEQSMNDFALAIDKLPKIVFSNTLKSTDWNTAELSDLSLEEKVKQLKQQPGKDIAIGSRSLINQLLRLNLLDELQLCVHPIVAGKGLQLFEHSDNRISLNLVNTKTLKSGAVILYYRL